MLNNRKDRGLIVIFGAPFRPFTTNTPITQLQIDDQLYVINNHLYFLNIIKQRYNIELDIQLITYNSTHNFILEEKYKPLNSVYLDFSKSVKHDPVPFYKQVFDKIYNESEYLFTFLMRLDICFKDFFINLFNPYEKCIHFSFPSVQAWRLKDFYVGDYLCFIPQTYITKLKQIKFYLFHNSSRQLQTYNINFCYYTNTIHHSNSKSGWNPFYFLRYRTMSKFIGVKPLKRIWYTFNNKQDIPQGYTFSFKNKSGVIYTYIDVYYNNLDTFNINEIDKCIKDERVNIEHKIIEQIQKEFNYKYGLYRERGGDIHTNPLGVNRAPEDNEDVSAILNSIILPIIQNLNTYKLQV